jgi:hypothetical protein
MRVLASFVAVAALASVASAQEPLTVHLTAGTARQTTRQEDRDLEARYRATQKTYAEVEKALKKQHGKDAEKWPEAAQAEMERAQDTMNQAGTDWFYSGIKQKDVDDTLKDLTEKLGEKTTVRIVPSAAEADLAVEVIGRGKIIREGWTGGEAAAELGMRVAPGGRLDPAALAKTGASFRAKTGFWSRAGAFTVHEYSPEAPYWVLVSRKPQIAFTFPWKGAAGQAADAFERFAAENATQLASARKAGK